MSNFDTERLNIQLVKELKAENEQLKAKNEELKRLLNDCYFPMKDSLISKSAIIETKS